MEPTYLNGIIEGMKESLERIEKKIGDWEPLCEGRRGYLHERINSLYRWMLGVGGIIIVGLIVNYFKRG